MPSWTGKVRIGARPSPLSKRQVEEVAEELSSIYPDLQLEPVYLETRGDRDQVTSLRRLGRSDFFTRELDELLLAGGCRVAVHSAKDLPEPMAERLTVVALTRGVNPTDSLVLREGESLRPQMVIATSSDRRAEVIRSICPDPIIVDIRGNVNERLRQLHKGRVDGVVVAEAALIRLKLTDCNRLTLPGETAAYQGQLAVVARTDDEEMAALFRPLDVRLGYSILYLGLDPSRHHLRGEITHYPVIRIEPLPFALPDFKRFTHLIVTSKTAVNLLFEEAPLFVGQIIAVGEATAHALRLRGMEPTLVAEEESSEGVVDLLSSHSFDGAQLLWPHSKRSRPAISDWAIEHGIALEELILYDTHPFQPSPPPDLGQFDEIAFTSPSTVEAFLKIYGQLPQDKVLWTQGEVTKSFLQLVLITDSPYKGSAR